MQDTYDVIVVGSGPGGYVAAIRAAQLGFKTAIVERAHLGGICSNWGCIPTKALLKSAEVLESARDSAKFGVQIEGTIAPDLSAMIERSRNVAARMSGGVGLLMRKNKIDVIWGEARLGDDRTIIVEAAHAHPRDSKLPPPKTTLGAGRYSARNIILATGARPRILPGMEPDGVRVWTYFEALAATEIPQHLVIVGSGAIGIEFASMYRALGSEVTVVEQAPSILPAEDAEISDFAMKAFSTRGIGFHVATTVTRLDRCTDGITAHLQANDGTMQTVQASHLLSATGVLPNIQGLGLSELGVALDGGFVRVDSSFQTNIPGIYAIGDITGGPLLAHKAEHEAIICAEAIAGSKPHALDRSHIPACTYSTPQIASLGLTEKEARATEAQLAIGKVPFQANGKAIAQSAEQGFVKVILDQVTGELLGAHLVGPQVTELIQGLVIAMEVEATDAELTNAVFPHPTVSETIKEAYLAALERAINL